MGEHLKIVFKVSLIMNDIFFCRIIIYFHIWYCYKTIILPVVLYGCKTWSLTVREEHKLRVFENRVLRIFGPKRDGVMGGGENCITRSFIICTLRQV
jgi:hypothetical protein